MSIDWQATVAQLDASPNINTPVGTRVLSALVSAGQQYETAGRPDVLRESAAHQAWARKSASQRLGIPEPSFYEGAYYARRVSQSGLTSIVQIINKPQLSAEDLAAFPADALSAYKYWQNRADKYPEERVASGAIARRIATVTLAKVREEEIARLPKGPANGAIQQALVSALAAAQAFLTT